jgi:hypothetical protein
VYITRVRVRTHEPTPECVCELNAYSIRARHSPPRTEDVLYGVECGMRPLTSESHRRRLEELTIISYSTIYSLFLIIGCDFYLLPLLLGLGSAVDGRPTWLNSGDLS